MEKYFIYKKTPIYYSLQGEGNTLVFLHGYLETKEVWKKIEDRLASKFQILTIDLLGHGKTGTLSDTHTMDQMADAVYAILQHLSISNIWLFGHSMGGYVSLAFSEKYPQCLCGLSLLHSVAKPDTQEKKKNRLREIEVVKSGKKYFIFSKNIPNTFAEENHEQYRQEILQIQCRAKQLSNRAIIAALQGMMQRPDRQHVLKNIRVPILLVFGAKDNLIPLEVAEEHSKLSPHIVVKVLENSGHTGFIEQSEETIDIIAKFVTQLPKC